MLALRSMIGSRIMVSGAVLAPLLLTVLMPDHQDLARVLTLGLLAFCIIRIFITEPILLLSPLLILSSMSAIFYFATTYIYVHFTWLFYFHPEPFRFAQGFLGSTGERAILLFSITCLSTLLLLQTWMPDAPAPPRDGRRQLPILSLAIVPLLLGLAWLASPIRTPPGEAGWLTGQLQFATQALIAFTMAAVSHFGIRGDGRLRLVSLSAAAFLFGAGIVCGNTKAAIFSSIFCLTYMALPKITPRSAVLLIVALAGLGVTGLLIMNLIRQPALRPEVGAMESFAGAVQKVITYKVITRQSVTGFCLSGVLRQHEIQSSEGNPFYFVAALIPRVLWPEKETLSHGTDYAQKFCGIDIDPVSPDSQSVTLLGEPLAVAGLPGLGAAMTLLLAGLCWATQALRRRRPVPVVIVLSLLPWIADFDQHFALGVAVVGKMVMVLVVPAVLLGLWWRQPLRTAPS